MVALCTCPSEEIAREIARALVEQRYAACVNRIPNVTSCYRWRGKVEEEAEVLLVIKTAAAVYEKMQHAIQQMHPYEVPEIIALPVRAGLPAYLNWVAESCGGG